MTDPKTNKYDQVPYLSLPYPATHPRNLEMLAVLFGMQPPAVPKCRILELGCASGGNLIPVADEYPEAHLMGIDLSSVQIDQGCSLVDRLGLTNIRLRHASITDVDDDWGRFDYIICHGVFAWVPTEVQEKILDICHRNLVANGVAIVSYNTYPGWHLRAVVRDIMRFHVAQFGEPRKQIDQAKAVLDFMSEYCNEQEAYGHLLKRELERVRKTDDSYLYHEHLEPFNQPLQFYQFVERAASHRLQYLAESSFTRMLTIDMPQRVQEALDGAPIIRQEQYLDYLRNSGFRSTLLCHENVDLKRNDLHERMTCYQVAWNASSQPLDVDLKDDQPVQFEIGGNKLTTALPLMKAACVHLGRIWPQYIAVPDLYRRSLEMLDVGESDVEKNPDLQTDRLTRPLLEAVATNLLDAYVHPPQWFPWLADAPRATALSRAQAAEGGLITNRHHETVRLDALGSFILQQLDGQNDREKLEQALYGALRQGLIATEQEDRQAHLSAEDISEMVTWALTTCANAGLLVA